MSYKIAIASGKGGTGKTTVSVNIFEHFNKNNQKKSVLVDCDVEEPNDAIFFNGIKKTASKEVLRLIPEIDTNKCTFCRKCVEFCEFNSIVVIPPAEFAEINSSLCHSCGACLFACKDNAIIEKTEQIGTLNFHQISENTELIEGRLKIGSAMQTMLIKELKKEVKNDNEIIIYDAPPGTSCPVVETITDADFIVLVSEPTPFGLHDLKLMVSLTKQLNKPFGIIINKAGLGDHQIYKYIDNEAIELIGEIPFSKNFAGNYASGKMLENPPREISESFSLIVEKLCKKITGL